MKVIGNVQIEQRNDDDGYPVVVNAEYAGGYIVMLSGREAGILKLLQGANDGALDSWPAPYADDRKPVDEPMDKAFWLIYQYVKARFALNDFKDAIDGIENRLKKLSEVPMDID